jgi:hypothetical protein
MHETANLTEIDCAVWVLLLSCKQRDGHKAGTLRFLLSKKKPISASEYKVQAKQYFADVIPETS